MTPDENRQVLRAGTGRAVMLSAGGELEVVNVTGTQVVDTWALRLPDLAVTLSMEHTRSVLGRLRPRRGDGLFGSDRRQMLTLTEDTSPGVHDTLIAACDAERYRLLGVKGFHANCHDNFLAALAEAQLGPRAVPAPLNLFQNTPWSPEGDLELASPASAPGDLVRLRAEVDVVVVISACPQDRVPVNGEAMQPTDVAYRVLRPS